MHSVFAMLLEVPSFKSKFSRGMAKDPPFDMRLQFSQKSEDRATCEFSTNGLMVQFVRSALTPATNADKFSEVECKTVALGGIKRLMTELDDSVKTWPDFKQPLPVELLVNLLNALEFERKFQVDRHLRLQPSDTFRLRIETHVKCPVCSHNQLLPKQSNYVLELLTNGCNDVAEMIDRKFSQRLKYDSFREVPG